MAEDKYILLSQALDVLDRRACWWAHTTMEEIPAADVVPVVRCKDCLAYESENEFCYVHADHMIEDDFCSLGLKGK